MASEGLLKNIRTDCLSLQTRLTLLRFYKSFEAQIFAVGGDRDGAAFAGGEDGGAVGLPALDHFLVWMTEHRVATDGDNCELRCGRADEVFC